MSLSALALKPLVLATLLGVGCAAHATFSAAYSSQASFLSAVTSPGLDTFNDLAPTSYGAPLNRAAGSFSYSVTSPSGLYGAGTALDAWLSNYDRTEDIVFTGFASGVRAFGGLLFGSTLQGTEAANRQITVTVIDSARAVSTTVLPSTTANSFFGITSTNPILTVAISSEDGIEVWPTVNNLMLASLPVPEPHTNALLIAGLGLIGLMRQRRRARRGRPTQSAPAISQ